MKYSFHILCVYRVEEEGTGRRVLEGITWIGGVSLKLGSQLEPRCQASHMVVATHPLPHTTLSRIFTTQLNIFLRVCSCQERFAFFFCCWRLATGRRNEKKNLKKAPKNLPFFFFECLGGWPREQEMGGKKKTRERTKNLPFFFY